MKIAVKFYSQHPNNKDNVPGFWPWKRVDIDDDMQSVYEQEDYTVFSTADFESYLTTNKVKLETHYINQAPQYKYLDISIESKKQFAAELIEKFKKKNITEGLNALQGLWMHQRVRKLPVTFMGVSFDIDLMNMVISGDLELACIALMNTPPDNMTLPYHWLSQDRLNWIIAELKLYLGWQ